MLTFLASGVRCSLLIRVRTCAVAPTVLPDVARDFGLPHSSPHEFVLTRVPWYEFVLTRILVVALLVHVQYRFISIYISANPFTSRQSLALQYGGSGRAV